MFTPFVAPVTPLEMNPKAKLIHRIESRFKELSNGVFGFFPATPEHGFFLRYRVRSGTIRNAECTEMHAENSCPSYTNAHAVHAGFQTITYTPPES